MKKHFKKLTIVAFAINLFFSCSPKIKLDNSTFAQDCSTKNYGDFTFINRSNATINITVWDNNKKISMGRFPEKLSLYGYGKFTISKMPPAIYYFESMAERVEGGLPYESYFVVEVCKKGELIFN